MQSNPVNNDNESTIESVGIIRVSVLRGSKNRVKLKIYVFFVGYTTNHMYLI